MQTSQQAIEFLERHEGVVLKAYRDVAGVWTIAAGLTAASGVVTPKAEMVITAAEASRLLQLALAHNYEPAVEAAMAGAKQHEFDAGVSFHFNTGAIARASWVGRWKIGDWAETRRRMMLWVKGGGKVLPGLERRRAEEYNLLRYGIYGAGADRPASPGQAKVILQVDAAVIADGLISLGYLDKGTVDLPAPAVRKFQSDHDLTVDGIVGAATLNTLQRMLDARRKAVAPAAATAGGLTEAQSSAVSDALQQIPHADLIGPALLALGLLWLTVLAWRYRDALAARLQSTLPGIARVLRSF